MIRRLGFIAIFLMISATSNADDFFNPPPLNPELPPWMQDANQAPASNTGQPATTPPPADASAPPADTSSVPDSGSEDDEAAPFDFEGSGGGGGPARDQGKNSFQIVDQYNQNNKDQDCVGWGSSFLGTKVFLSENLCRTELDQEIESARDTVNNYQDHTEKEVLRGVIRGKIPREKSKDFHLEFGSLRTSLGLAAKTGCKCLE